MILKTHQISPGAEIEQKYGAFTTYPGSLFIGAQPKKPNFTWPVFPQLPKFAWWTPQIFPTWKHTKIKLVKQ